MTEQLENKANEIWSEIISSAKELVKTESLLEDLIDEVILSSENLFEALAKRLSRKLGRNALDETSLKNLFNSIFANQESIQKNVLMDLQAIRDRDPACECYMQAILYFKGFLAISLYRLANHLWNKGRKQLAYYLQNLSSEIFAVDIHPAAKFGGGILLDHATSFVAGETSQVEDNVSILHEVTLGGTGKSCGDRHPKIRSGVLIGAGAKLIGNIVIGECAKIGAGSVVLEDVEAHCTVAGVPAKKVGLTCDCEPSKLMNQNLA